MKLIFAMASLLCAGTCSATAQQTPIAPQAPAQQWVGPQVTLQTTMGDIVLTLDPAGAPKTAEHFIGLVKSGQFNGASFYRIEPGFLIQLGDLDAKYEYRAPKLPTVPLETANNRHTRGAVALARADDPNSGHATFYIDLAENPHLNATANAPPNTTGYAVFGHVTAGMEVAEAISNVERAPDGGPFPGKLPKSPVLVNKAVVTKE